jgi:uncharacterized protein YuzB (UPF0349 family)
MVQAIPGARSQAHAALEAGHFIQDNKGEELAERIITFIAETPLLDAQP